MKRWRYFGGALLCLAFVCLSFTGALAQENLLKNGDFEAVTDEWPDGWMADMWIFDAGTSYVELADGGVNGGRCVLVENVLSNDARVTQTVKVTPNTWYKLSGWIRAERCGTEGLGANLSVLGSYAEIPSVYDTEGEWTEWTLYFRTYAGQTSATIAARLGGYSSDNTGRAWFDNLSLEQVDGLPADAFGLQLEVPPTRISPDADEPAAQAGAMPLTLLVFLVAAGILWLYAGQSGHPLPKAALPLLLLAAFVLRVVIAVQVEGYDVDIGCFHAWSLRMAEVGPAHFYADGYFCDYPPGYLYVLWICGAVLRAMGWFARNAGVLLVLKMPPILADLATVYLLYRWTREKLGERGAFALATLYALNPAVLVTGAAWGQIDAVLALGLFLTLHFAAREDYRKAFPVYLITVLVKPQALMLAPLGLVALLVHWSSRKWDRKVILRSLSGLGIGAALALALLIPFTAKEGFGWVIGKYTDTLSSYAYATINTANFLYLLGGNWTALSQPALGGLSFGTLCVALMVLVVAYTLFLSVRGKRPETLYLVAALTFLGLYVFGYRMHERYLVPALILLAFAYAKQRDGRLLVLLAGLSVTMFFNVWLVLRNEHLVSGLTTVSMILAFANLVMTLWAFWIGYDLCVAGRIRPLPLPSAAQGGRAQEADLSGRILGKSDYRLRLGRWDWILMLALTLVYGVVAFVGLGSTKAPQTGWVSTGIDETIVFDLGESHDFQTLYYGGISAKNFTLSTSEDGQTWSEEWPAQMDEGQCFRWKYLTQAVIGADGSAAEWKDELIVWLSGRYVRLSAAMPGLNLLEVAFRDEAGNPIPVQSVEAAGGREGSANDPALLTDEADTVPEQPGYYSGTYFDEIYHARTGYEHLHGLNTHEYTHPPLGKVMIMFAINAFGMTPFGWRFAGTVVGILMVPAMYLIGMQLFKQRRWAFMAAFLMAFDMMHLTQTRIATIDSYPVLFIILSYLCMFRYLQMSFFRDGVRRTLLPLALCGLFMGLGIASKWIGIYAGVGLAALFVWAMGMRLREYLHAYRNGSDALRAAVANYPRQMAATLLWCLLWFVIVPLGIYALSYIPQLKGANGQYTLERLWDTQIAMLNYHSHLKDTHGFQSKWWEWPLMLKPMWYYLGHYEPEGLVSTIMCMGNPAVWWAGVVSLLAVLAAWVRGHITRRGIALDAAAGDAVPSMLLLGFLAQYLPWVLVPRSTFIYHYFASLPFVMLCVVWCFRRLEAWNPRATRRIAVGYMAVILLLFAAFYPYATGVFMTEGWARAMNWFGNLYLPGWLYRGWLYY